MLERPDIPDKLIAAGIQAEYGLKPASVTFLPWGYDVHTAVYRVDGPGGTAYFLKLRKGDFDPITVDVPHFLSSLGISTIIAPLETLKGQLFGRFFGEGKEYTMILYPFIPGKDGYQVRLADRHWIELGRTLQKVHTAMVPSALMPLIPCETYNPDWRESVRRFQAQVEETTFGDPVVEKLSTFMKARRQEISRMLGRADELAHSLSQHSQDLVLCHSDAHPGNFLLADSGELYLVDWDNPIFAPKEADLMFFGAGMSGDQPGGRESACSIRVMDQHRWT